MAFDSLVLAAVVRELREEIIGAKINKVHQPDKHTLLLRYHGTAGGGRLLLSAHPQNSRLHRTAAAPENPAQAPLFAMVLRKWLEGARIVGIGATEGERVAELIIESRDELGDPRRLRLIIEIMGKHSNIILVGVDGAIIDGIRRYGSSLSRYREVLPGRPYLAPPLQDKLPLPPANEEVLAAALYAEGELTLSEALRRRVSGLSPLVAEHVALSAGCEPELSVEQLGALEISRLFAALLGLRRMVASNGFQPTLLQEKGGYSDFAALAPEQWPKERRSSRASMNEAVDAWYAAREAEQSFIARKQAVARQLRRHIARLSKKIALEEADLAQAEAGDKYKQAGDLLAAHLWRLEKGLAAVTLPLFSDPEQTVTLALDPALTPQENIQRCYRRYSKAKNARAPIERQLTLNREELDYLLSIDQAVADSADEADLTEPEREAAAAGYISRPAPHGKQARKKEDKHPPALPPRRYQTSDGLTVLIGRNNKQNDRLSLKQAAEDDLWLHAQKIPGAHAVIVSNGRAVPERSLREAASWAAWFSKAKDSAQVPVDYLPAGKLKKPPGARAGYVTYSGQRTVFITPAQPPAEI